MPRDEETKLNQKKKGRGKTLMKGVYTRNFREPIDLDEYGTPKTQKGNEVAHYMKTEITDSKIVPMDIFSWTKVTNQVKDNLWEIAQKKYIINLEGKKWFDKKMGKLIRDYRSDLKKTHYNKERTLEANIQNRPKDVPENVWADLVRYWHSPETQAISEVNAQHRAQQTMLHTTGSKSFSRVREEEHLRRGDGTHPSRCDMFMITHKHKDGTWIDLEAKQVGLEMQSQLTQYATQSSVDASCNMDDVVYAEVRGPKKYGRVRSMGMGPSPTSYKTTSARSDGATSGHPPSPSSGEHARTQLQDPCANPESSNQGLTQATAIGVGDFVKVLDDVGVVIAIGAVISTDNQYVAQVSGSLGPYSVAICIDYPSQPNFLLDNPVGEFKTIGGASGAIIKWHKTVLRPLGS